MRFWICLGLLVLAACKHDDGVAIGTATIHSGTPDGPKVTNLRHDERAELGDALARALCTHERTCSTEAPETRPLREEVCFSDSRGGTRIAIEQWRCEPSAARPGFDRCLAAIREASCGARIGENTQIPACRAEAICPRSNG